MVIASHLEYHGFQLVGRWTMAWVTEASSLTARLRVCQFVAWSLVQGQTCGFNHDMWVVGRVRQEVVRYRSDSMGTGSVDENVVVYGKGSFVKGVVQTREYCMYVCMYILLINNCIKNIHTLHIHTNVVT